MNKRLHQLANEARIEVGQRIGYNDRAREDAFEEVFAELIVRECIVITDGLVNRNADGTWTSNELYTDYNGALFEVKRRIEEHFGVEE
jgi:hypothetical protein